jgi:acid phosphatase (class A)
MNIRSLLLVLTAAAVTAGPAAFAADVAATPAAPARFVAPGGKTLHILTEAQLDPGKLLPAPAADGTDLQRADLADVQRVYKTRSPERRAQAEWDDKHETVELFFKTLGPEFDLKKLPKTAKLITALENEQSVAANIAKRHFLRNRPWAIDASLVACDYKPNAAPLTSYPSGHATLSYSEGYILAELMPEKAAPILGRAQEYAYSRVVCGAHYASDIEASHVLGTELAMMLLDNAKFAADFQESRAELRAAGLTR